MVEQVEVREFLRREVDALASKLIALVEGDHPGAPRELQARAVRSLMVRYAKEALREMGEPDDEHSMAILQRLVDERLAAWS